MSQIEYYLGDDVSKRLTNYSDFLMEGMQLFYVSVPKLRKGVIMLVDKKYKNIIKVLQNEHSKVLCAKTELGLDEYPGFNFNR